MAEPSEEKPAATEQGAEEGPPETAAKEPAAAETKPEDAPGRAAKEEPAASGAGTAAGEGGDSGEPGDERKNNAPASSPFLGKMWSPSLPTGPLARL